MDSIFPSTSSPLVSTTTPVFGDNVQELLNAGLLNIKPTATIVVNSINDVPGQTGVTTLRDAINKANADSGEDLIVFDRTLFSTAQRITLSSGELDLTQNVDIIAPKDNLTGENLVTVSGNGSRVFKIETGATVNLFGLIVANGFVLNDQGGGIKNSGTLTLDSSIVRRNSSTNSMPLSSVGSVGGGIFSNGMLKINNSTITNNTAGGSSQFGSGGGINANIVEINNSTISDNTAGGRAARGGGITSGSLKITNSTISGNSAGELGGGISGSNVEINNSTISGNSASGLTSGQGGAINSSGSLKINNSIISSNSARLNGGGIYSTGTNVEINNSTISNNRSTGGFNGGGIYKQRGGINQQRGNLTVTNSTIINNQAFQGGGIDNDGNLTVINSTISANSATAGVNPFQQILPGGGVHHAGGSMTLLFSTITLNVGGGVTGGGSVRNTIIASNLINTGGTQSDVFGTFTSGGYNLIGNSTGSTGFGATGDIIGTSNSPIDPRLDILASNGGRTQTIALLPGSPAINAADPTILSTDPTTDQSGRPRVRRGRADIGAFESALKN